MSRLKKSLIKLRNSTTVTTAAVLYLSYTAAPLLPAHVGAQRAKVPGFSLLFREATDVHCTLLIFTGIYRGFTGIYAYRGFKITGIAGNRGSL